MYIQTDIARTAMDFQAKTSLDEGTKSIYNFSNDKLTMV